MPLGEVITRFVPSVLIATKRDKPGDQHISFHEFASAADRLVHVMPLGEVITLFVPSAETAQNKSRSGDQQTDCQLFASAAVLAVHVMPLGEVATEPSSATATKSDNSGDHAGEAK